MVPLSPPGRADARHVAAEDLLDVAKWYIALSTYTDPDPAEGVEFIFEDGLVTARDVESGVASCGDSKSEALSMLSEALELHESDEVTVEDEDAVLRDIGLDPEEIHAAREENDELPEFLR